MVLVNHILHDGTRLLQGKYLEMEQENLCSILCPMTSLKNCNSYNVVIHLSDIWSRENKHVLTRLFSMNDSLIQKLMSL